MTDGHGRFSSERYSMMTHLRPDERVARHLDRAGSPDHAGAKAARDPRPIHAHWDERVITCTGPHTFRVRMPIDVPLPSETAVRAFADELEARWLDIDAGRYGMQVKAVRGSVDEGRTRGVLTLLVTTSGGDDRHVDAARIGELVRAEARRDHARTRTSNR